jgi:4'-phosphopantetheinyl transferase EntD
VLELILPPEVAVASSRGDLEGATLFGAEEEEVVARAVVARRREFATGRACARRALARLGRPPQAIASGPHGEPCWPAGIVGSITHCDGYRAAALASSRGFATIGIDAEPNRPLPPRVLDAIALPQERAGVRELGARTPEVHWDRLLFSLKETVYKAWFSLTATRLGFADASIDLAPGGGWSARFHPPGPSADGRPALLRGRWLAGDSLLVSAVALPRKCGELTRLRR